MNGADFLQPSKIEMLYQDNDHYLKALASRLLRQPLRRLVICYHIINHLNPLASSL